MKIDVVYVSDIINRVFFVPFSGIHGLLPPRVKSQDEQVDNCLRNRKSPISNFATNSERAREVVVGLIFRLG